MHQNWKPIGTAKKQVKIVRLGAHVGHHPLIVIVDREIRAFDFDVGVRSTVIGNLSRECVLESFLFARDKFEFHGF